MCVVHTIVIINVLRACVCVCVSYFHVLGQISSSEVGFVEEMGKAGSREAPQ